MGSGCWTKAAYVDYCTTNNIDTTTISSSNLNQFYTQREINSDLSPYNVVRKCVDSEEHPNTIPVILALDVTGSMGSASAAIARKLDDIMTSVFDKVKDVEFMVMGIGDIEYDKAPIQVSQFESDVRISDWLSKIWQEHGGGGNRYESYSAAWYFGLNRTKLDCWKRGKKGIIITMGDENLNPYLRGKRLERYIGQKNSQAEIEDVDTQKLYDAAKEKFDMFHILITDPQTAYCHYSDTAPDSFKRVMGEQHVFESNSDSLEKLITDIIVSCSEQNSSEWDNCIVKNNTAATSVDDSDGIGW